jgi:hypothetical protein
MTDGAPRWPNELLGPEVLAGEPLYTQAVYFVLTELGPFASAMSFQHTRRVTVEKKRPVIPSRFPAGVGALGGRAREAPGVRPNRDCDGKQGIARGRE